jgi:Rad3-related DNA helicase
MRPRQKEVLDEIEKALAERKKFIILEAPVGFGKSAIAAALCKHLGSAYLLTSTKQLQDQYSSDFGFLMVMGKANFTCLVPTASGRSLACSQGKCMVDWKLSECPHYISFEEYEAHRLHACRRDAKCEHLEDGKLCYYYTQKWDGLWAQTMVANYPLFLSELKYTEDINRRKLLVCDEAHDLERQMIGFTSYSLKKTLLQNYNTGNSEVNIADRGQESIAWLDQLAEAKKRLEGFIGQNGDDDSVQDQVASCKSSLTSLESFMKDLEEVPDNWIVNKTKRSEDGISVDEVAFQPLEVGAYTGWLFDTAETVLFMSATIFSKEAFCRTAGVPEEEATFIRVKNSSFPVENRWIYSLAVARLNRESMDASLGEIAMVVDEIMTQHSGERGIIHTTSYAQDRYIREHVSPQNRMRLSSTEGVSSRHALLKAHGSKDESVLISPSLHQGVDLRDELSRFQVLVKVPYPDLSDRRTRIKLEKNPSWYDWQTALRLVQTYGRSIRSETDHAITYILDSNFPSFLRNHRDLFPEYFLEAIQTRGEGPRIEEKK